MKKLMILLTAVFAMSITANAQDWKADLERVKAVSDFLKKFSLVIQESAATSYVVMNYPITYYDVYAITGKWTNPRNVAVNDVVVMTLDQQKDLASQASQLYVINNQSKMAMKLATDDQLSKAIQKRINIQSESGPYNHSTKGFYLSMSFKSNTAKLRFNKELEKILASSTPTGESGGLFDVDNSYNGTVILDKIEDIIE